MGRPEKQNDQHVAARLFFVVYCALMLWLLFGQRMGEGISVGSVNLIPLETIKLYMRLRQSSNSYFMQHAYVNLIGNVVMFIPLGIFLPWIWQRLRSFFKVLLIVVVIIVCIEALQYAFSLGSCDIDDLILNVPGAMIGYGLWGLFRR